MEYMALATGIRVALLSGMTGSAIMEYSQKLIRQEIYASLTLFNFSRIIINNSPPVQKAEWKWHYKVNFKTAVTNIRLYLDRKINEAELEKRKKKFLTPIRPGRKYSRNVKPQACKTSSYYTA